jgi:hypothetical protein
MPCGGLGSPGSTAEAAPSTPGRLSGTVLSDGGAFRKVNSGLITTAFLAAAYSTALSSAASSRNDSSDT